MRLKPYKTKLTRIGDSYGIIIPKPIREILALEPGEPIYLTLSGENVYLSFPRG